VRLSYFKDFMNKNGSREYINVANGRAVPTGICPLLDIFAIPIIRTSRIDMENPKTIGRTENFPIFQFILVTHVSKISFICF